MEHLFKFLSFSSVGLLVLVLIAATLLESVFGSSFAIDNVYHSLWFIALWSSLAVTAMLYILRVSRRFTLLLLHVSFVVVLLGALVSFLTASHGSMSVERQGLPASMYTTADGGLEKLPFRLCLTDIDTVYSAETASPVGYKAYIVADDKNECTLHIISLNSPVRIKGYQFCIKGVADDNLSMLVSCDKYGCTISYMGYLLVFFSFVMLFFDRQSGFYSVLQQLRGKAVDEKVDRCVCYRTLIGRVLGVLALPVILLAFLWYKRGVFPATNGVETLFLFAFVVIVIALLLRLIKRFSHLSNALIVLAFASTVFAVYGLDWSGDVQPILRTPLLGVHVTTIIIAYALIGCTAMNAVIALCSKDQKMRAAQALLGRLLLYPATMLLAAGIFIGAVWANISWGRYWGWDPKEVWALVTLLVCSVAFHTRSLCFISRPTAFHLFCIVAFISVLFTYFGVNHLLGGLHSYM